MNLSQFLSVLLARKKIAIWVFLVTVIVTTLLSFLLPKTYTATTSLVINSKGVDPITGLALPATLMPGYMATQTDIISSHNVALKVVDRLDVVSNAVAKAQFNAATKGEGNIRDWYADLFLQNVDVDPARESSVIKISYQGSDPKFSATLANAFAEAYIETNLQLKTDPAKQAATFFDGQIKSLRENIEKAQNKLSFYQKEHGIVSADERIDMETGRLSELSSQLVAAQAQTYDSNSRQSQLNRGKAGESPEILANSLIQGLKSQLVQSESRLSEISQRLNKNHPQYQAAQAEVDNLHTRIAEEIAKTSSGVSQSARVSQQKEGEIRAALAAQKERVLKLKSQHDDMSVLVREVENAQHIYDSATQRFGQTNMESQSLQTDISILNPAIPPTLPSSPKRLINILLSIFLGGLLAIAFAVMAEMLDRRVRTVDDLSRNLGMPLLADLSKSRIKMSVIDSIKRMLKKSKTKKPMVPNYQFSTK